MSLRWGSSDRGCSKNILSCCSPYFGTLGVNQEHTFSTGNINMVFLLRYLRRYGAQKHVYLYIRGIYDLHAE
jgi:hypothetical protein